MLDVLVITEAELRQVPRLDDSMHSGRVTGLGGRVAVVVSDRNVDMGAFQQLMNG